MADFHPGALLGVVNAFDIPARQSFLVDMVGKEDLMNAIALNSSMFNAARIIGPAIAGILVAKIGEGWCFFSNGVSYIAVILGLMMMRVAAPARLAARLRRWRTSLKAFASCGTRGRFVAILLLLGLVSLVAMPYTVLMPIFADRILHGGARGLGILMGATGVGALLGALTLASRSGVRGLGALGGVFLRRLWLLPGAVCLLANFLAFRRVAVAGGLLHDAADVFLQHADSGHVAGQSARPGDGGVFHDVHGMAPFGALFGGRSGGSPRRALDRGRGRVAAIGGGSLVLSHSAEDPGGSHGD